MKLNSVAIISAALLSACGGESDNRRASEHLAVDRVDSCDLRRVTGTCVEYTMSELGDWYRENVARICPNNKRGEFVGTYHERRRCPAENRVARCEGMVEDSEERYEYDKHYYTGTADGFSWEPENVRATCDYISGQFVLE